MDTDTLDAVLHAKATAEEATIALGALGYIDDSQQDRLEQAIIHFGQAATLCRLLAQTMLPPAEIAAARRLMGQQTKD